MTRPCTAIIDRDGAATPEIVTSSASARRRVSSSFAVIASFCNPNTASAPDTCRRILGSVRSLANTRCAGTDAASFSASSVSSASSLSV